MRIVATTLLAFLLSGFAGGMVAQVLAVQTGAQEEFILVFMFSALVTLVVTVFFFIAQFFADQRRGVRIVALVLLGLFALASLELGLMIVFGEGNLDSLPLVTGLVLPGTMTILVQWLIVHWRAGPSRATPAARFGRGA